MNGFDIIVFIIIGVAAIGGFLRGLVQEVLSLAAWALAAAAIYYLHEPFTEILLEYLDAEPTTSILAFALLLLIPYAAMKLIANNVGEASRGSIMGPIDRVLGFGFGVVKGALRQFTVGALAAAVTFVIGRVIGDLTGLSSTGLG